MTPRTWSKWLKLFLVWILLTSVGWTVGMAVTIEYQLQGAALLLGYLVLGIAVGLGQWMVLRSKLLGAGWERGAGWWVLSTVLGFTVGFFVVVILNTIGLGFISIAMYGAMVGLAQWFVLRQRVRMSGWWILATIIGWLAAWSVDLAVFWQGMIVGGATGIALVLLSARSSDESITQAAKE